MSFQRSDKNDVTVNDYVPKDIVRDPKVMKILGPNRPCPSNRHLSIL